MSCESWTVSCKTGELLANAFDRTGKAVADGEVGLFVRAELVFFAEAGDFDDWESHKSVEVWLVVSS